MRIAVFTNAYPPDARGGAGRIAFLQAELLKQRGHEVRVWTASLAWTSSPLWKRLFFHARDLAWVHPCLEEMRTWKPDVLLTHNLTGAGFRTPRAIKAPRWIHLLHDVQLFYPLGLLKDDREITLLQHVVTCLRKRAFGSPDVVVSPTAWLLEAHQRRGWFRDMETVVVPNPAPAYTGSVCDDWATPPTILFVGRQTEDKGGHIFRALQQTAKRSIQWKVVDGVSPEQVLAEMRRADLLLAPSQILENQPTVLLEAFASGLPVVASDRGGIPETLGQAGAIVASFDVSEWWSAIERIFAHPRTYWVNRLVQSWQRHDPERVVDALLGVLKSNKKT